MAKIDITPQSLREVLNYDPETGTFTAKVTKGNWRAGRNVGAKGSQGYIRVGIAGSYQAAHRLAWFFTHGVWPSGTIDHINGERDDNRIENLRDASCLLNNQNVRDARSDNISGFLGVSEKKDGSFRVLIRAQLAGQRVQIYLGRYSNAETAHAVYMDAKRRLHDGCTI